MAPTTPETAALQEAPAADPSDLDQLVLGLLRARYGDWKRIADESGVVSYSWISKFANGHIPNAGVSTLKTLRDWLLAHPAPSAPVGDDDNGTRADLTPQP